MQSKQYRKENFLRYTKELIKRFPERSELSGILEKENIVTALGVNENGKLTFNGTEITGGSSGGSSSGEDEEIDIDAEIQQTIDELNEEGGN